MAVKYKEYKPGTYADSDAVKGALNELNTLKAQEFKDLQLEDFKNSQQTTDAWNQYNNLKGPGDFNFAHQQGWDDIINKINNREKFSYDVNGDALYQQYKDQYVTGGKMAMMDTMGQAAAMTGGYGNSYAQSVGQQAYQGYLQQLNDKIPELYSLALSKYQMEGDDLYKQHGLYTDLFNRDYGMHRDAVGDFQYQQSHLLDLWGKSHAVDVDKYNIYRDNTVAETESYNSNLANKQDLAFKIYTDLRDTEYGRYMDNETLKKLAIEVANDNTYKEEQTRIADAELKAKQDAIDFKALEEKYEGYISPEELAKQQKAENSEATKTFKASVMTRTELGRRGFQTQVGGKTKRFDNYQQYIDAVLENHYKEGKLTENEVAYLKAYYGIE